MICYQRNVLWKDILFIINLYVFILKSSENTTENADVYIRLTVGGWHFFFDLMSIVKSTEKCLRNTFLTYIQPCNRVGDKKQNERKTVCKAIRTQRTLTYKYDLIVRIRARIWCNKCSFVAQKFFTLHLAYSMISLIRNCSDWSIKMNFLWERFYVHLFSFINYKSKKEKINKNPNLEA